MVRHKTNPWRETVTALTAGALLMTLAACSTNPATGKRQIALVSEQQEIEMGLEADKQIEAQMGLYPDERLQSYVAGLGRKLAAGSRAAGAAWTFKVVDDPVVNAFALPGGFIYVTRGLLAHLTSEAELVVRPRARDRPRHRRATRVEQMSKAQLAQIGLVAGMILSPQAAAVRRPGPGRPRPPVPEVQPRRREPGRRPRPALPRSRESYDPREMPKVFETLRPGEPAQRRRAGGCPTGSRPTRRPRTASSASAPPGGAADQDFAGARWTASATCGHIDSMVFGENPREGFFDAATSSVQPELGFQVRFPQGWKTTNQKQAVGAISPREDAVVVVSLSGQSSPQAAAQAFFAQQGIQQGQALNNGAGEVAARGR